MQMMMQIMRLHKQHSTEFEWNSKYVKNSGDAANYIQRGWRMSLVSTQTFGDVDFVAIIIVASQVDDDRRRNVEVEA